MAEMRLAGYTHTLSHLYPSIAIAFNVGTCLQLDKNNLAGTSTAIFIAKSGHGDISGGDLYLAEVDILIEMTAGTLVVGRFEELLHGNLPVSATGYAARIAIVFHFPAHVARLAARVTAEDFEANDALGGGGEEGDENGADYFERLLECDLDEVDGGTGGVLGEAAKMVNADWEALVTAEPTFELTALKGQLTINR
jgi:hypothetical protein